ncbi:Phosphatidylinositol 4-kinase pik1alpha (PI4-kinase)(PtdIns-4-kinase) [Coemansia biformis]|uniref:1-phosphatidylinositol 4-kinase n=1 Tax=Coemansia biformis TaxID=1286918 RepID=A0A9W7YFV4_9FUNG|nr:Phosphatidylinositol 4-kinase pik1alpha (PI4-kinase)(PtdIns-4-kinase) [Coemansia biformis]
MGGSGAGAGAKAASQRRPSRSSARSSSLLLRLFTSQFFDAWLAVSYIFRYPHVVGVQHYLCNELRKFPLAEAEFFLPQLVHLLITRPNESVALESLLMDMSLRSAHVATILYWYLQAYLADLSPNPRTIQFKHCQRIFNQVQELLFTDIAPELIIDAPESIQHAYQQALKHVKSAIPLPGPAASLAARFQAMFRLAPQVRENSQAALVGIASAMSSVGAPKLASTMGWLAVAQAQSVKLPERAGDDLVLAPQHRSLSGKTRGTSSPAPSRPRAMARGRPVSYMGVPGNHAADRISSTMQLPPVPAQGTFAVEECPRRAQGSSASQPASPAQPGRASSHDAASEAASGALRSASAAWEPSSSAGVQRGTVGSGSPTPAQRLSVDSCRTVAIMEGLEPAGAMPPATMSDGRAGAGTASMESCRNYLDRATRQFRRSARQIDRRLSRSSRDPQSPPDAGGGSWQSASCDWHAGRAEVMGATLDGMATYMEGERTKLELRAGYFGAEIKFITALMDISQRVCAVPKAGRQQFLKAELTLFNHTLDRHACIPLWCPDSDGSHHHQIVRIPTEDTVVLNSAERAPYLLTLEVLGPHDGDGAGGQRRPTSLGTAVTPAPASPLVSAPVSAPALISMSATDHTAAPPTPDVTGGEPLPPTAGQDTHEAPARDGDTEGDGRSSSGSRGAPALQPLSPAAPEDVDDRLMAEIFGDIEDVCSIPHSPRSPNTDRRLAESRRGGQASGGGGAGGEGPGAAYADTADQAYAGAGKTSASANRGPAAFAAATPGAHGEAETLRQSISHEDIRARMRTASILLAQLARQQKALGIKVADLVVSQAAGTGDGDSGKSESPEATRPRSKLGNATAQALVMEEIRAKLVREMMQLEEIRLKQPGLESATGLAQDGGASAGKDMGDSISLHEVEFKDDPSARVLKEDWESKKARIRRTSPFGRKRNWNLLSVIVKEGADLRQEQLAVQLIREMQRIWQREGTRVFVQYYRIMVTGEGCGLMETITNTVSVHSIKKEFYSRNPGYSGPPYTLYNYFITSYGTPDTQRFREAQDCFMRSLVSYSLATYILQIRDRHNGNILVDTSGHVIHIDFGFMLHNSPGSVGFEQAPFKLSMEYVDILGGRAGAKFAEFRDLLLAAFLALRRHADHICLLVEMMAKDSPLPCLGGGQATVAALRERFHPALSEQQIGDLVDSMLVSSCDNITTRMYDAFQYYSNGIL